MTDLLQKGVRVSYFFFVGEYKTLIFRWVGVWIEVDVLGPQGWDSDFSTQNWSRASGIFDCIKFSQLVNFMTKISFFTLIWPFNVPKLSSILMFRITPRELVLPISFPFMFIAAQHLRLLRVQLDLSFHHVGGASYFSPSSDILDRHNLLFTEKWASIRSCSHRLS